ncbi:hypothetical protein GCM10022233_69960 [Streptomyces shaanxiensis]|uniref:Uncharacterized protein n=1 Tax=Streptomyces shaanxiensis TaxID=653357 RepID=A0ABP7W3J8_9ACTN
MPPDRVAPGVSGAVGGTYGRLVDGDAQAGGVVAGCVSVDEAERGGVGEVGEITNLKKHGLAIDRFPAAAAPGGTMPR